jgi:hypothetical protein
MQVQRFEIYIKHNDEIGVIQIIQTDINGNLIDPISLMVSSEFIMAFTNLLDTELHNTNTVLTNQVASLLVDKLALQAQVNSSTTTIAALQATIQTQTIALLPWNIRHISPIKFVERFTAIQARQFERSIDPVLIGGRQLLDQYIDNNYYIDLDDPQVVGLIDYMIIVGILTDQERNVILRDSDNSEKYVA